MLNKVRSFISLLKYTPLHPQWHTLRHDKSLLEQICGLCTSGSVLDIGCGDQAARMKLNPGCRYIGLDYYETAKYWYGTRPQVYGDAHSLPFKDETVDTILLLDVLEHLETAEQCLAEVSRVLRSQGSVVIQVPFIYPLHDRPRDFQRWSTYGLRSLCEKNGFSVEHESYYGTPPETAALIFNIAFSKIILNSINNKNPFALVIFLAPFLIPFVNILAWTVAKITPEDDMMPCSLRMILVKN